MDRLADLHIHTTASDGALTPMQAVEAAAGRELAAAAITDHDTVGGIEEAVSAGERLGVEVVPGIEISTIHQDRVEVHILGYFIDYTDRNLLNKLRVLLDARKERARKMVELLNTAGIAVDFERVKEIAKGGAIGRPHVAKAVCETGAVGSMDSAFGRFLQEGKPAFVPRYKVSPEEAIEIIREAGGVACCAHIGKLHRDELVLGLVQNGLSGIEVYHPDHNSAATRFYRGFAARRGLIATGGSDAHCFEKGKQGFVGDVTVPYEVVEQLRNAAGRPR